MLTRIIFLLTAVCISACVSSDADLIEASKSGDLYLVQELIDSGSDVNGRDDSGQSPLHHAVYFGRFDVMALLINRGADVNIKVPQMDLTPLHAATMNGDLMIVKFLVEHGAQVNAKDVEGATPIFAACWIGSLPVVEYLANNRADLKAATDYGTSLLHHASQSGNFELVEYLINKGLDVNKMADNGATPLHIAVTIRNKEIVELLLANKASVNARLKSDYTFMQCINAPIISDDDIIEFTVYQSQTPADIAEEMGYSEIARLVKQNIS